jgi:hypothetical protein
MARGKSGRVSGINFGRAARRSAAAIGSEGVANGSDGMLGTEAGKVHDGPGNIRKVWLLWKHKCCSRQQHCAMERRVWLNCNSV